MKLDQVGLVELLGLIKLLLHLLPTSMHLLLQLPQQHALLLGLVLVALQKLQELLLFALLLSLELDYLVRKFVNVAIFSQACPL